VIDVGHPHLGLPLDEARLKEPIYVLPSSILTCQSQQHKERQAWSIRRRYRILKLMNELEGQKSTIYKVLEQIKTTFADIKIHKALSISKGDYNAASKDRDMELSVLKRIGAIVSILQ
jgi:hypothetical protein